MAGTFNTVFSKIVPNLMIDNNLGCDITNPIITDPVFFATKRCGNHQSILEIRK